MYLNASESVALAKSLAAEKIPSDRFQFAVFPNTLAFTAVRDVLAETTIKLGAQTCNWTPRGAYTGAVSAEFFAEAGASYALAGHSERRHIFGETDSDVRKKINACFDAGIIPVVCIGETREEKESGRREYRLKKQIMKAFENLELLGRSIMIAYEPVWAIYPGDFCTSADADDVHGWIKQEVRQYAAEPVPVLFGGSVNPQTVKDYLSLETIDGVLVGNASTKFDSLHELVRAVGA